MTRLDDGAIRLRDGQTVWQAEALRPMPAPRSPTVTQTDFVIVGAGITGAFLAERLTRGGASCVVIDRHAPASGSTAASTAMLLWELDASLLELEQRFGSVAAGRIAHDCLERVRAIGALAHGLNIACDFAFRPSLYLAGDKLDATDLREEARLRCHLGITGEVLDSGALAARGVIGDGALLYGGAAEADPVKLARGLLAAAVARRARIITPAVAMVYETLPDGVVVSTREGDVVRARWLVLANGYEMPDFVPVGRHHIVQTWAIATEAIAQRPWAGDALVWEASDPYLYMRTTAEGRVIVGGADEEGVDPAAAARSTPAKTRELLAAGTGRCPGLAGLQAEFAWTGAFGVTDDSLPFIGRVPGRPWCLAAYGYGGNGITFSALAAELIAAELEGGPHADAPLYALDRDG
ncbi:MAG: FAD-dependent oxidoreductase [Hyphomonadaceae bacterium]